MLNHYKTHIDAAKSKSCALLVDKDVESILAKSGPNYSLSISESYKLAQSIICNEDSKNKDDNITPKEVTVAPCTFIEDKLVIDFNQNSYEFHLFTATDLDEESEDSEASDEDSDIEESKIQKVSFEDEIKQIVLRQIEEGHTIDSIKIEINSVRFSENKTLVDCLVAIVPPLISSVINHDQVPINKSIISLQELFTSYADLLKSFILTKNDEAHLIECVEK